MIIEVERKIYKKVREGSRSEIGKERWTHTYCIPSAAAELIKFATVGEDDEGNLSITENR